jgi:hypothetical protein
MGADQGAGRRARDHGSNLELIMSARAVWVFIPQPCQGFRDAMHTLCPPHPSYDPPRITIRLPTVTKDAEGNITKKPAYDTSDLPEAYTVDIPLESETSKVHAKPTFLPLPLPKRQPFRNPPTPLLFSKHKRVFRLCMVHCRYPPGKRDLESPCKAEKHVCVY